MKTLSVEIWSDIACPWCYVGKRRLEAALARFPHREHVAISWRAFELDPSAPRALDLSVSYAARLAAKYGRSVEDAAGMISNMAGVARGDGIEMDFENIRPGNTFDAHRLRHLAAEQGLGDDAKEALFKAYLSDGRCVGDRETLLAIGVELGLQASAVMAALESDAYADDVRGEEAAARAIGITGVPFFVFDRRFGVSGAQSSAMLLGALTQAWESEPEPEPEAAEGETCGPEGCE
jgi:predicted DsbA family dithiol-disulfide isomerase